MSQESGARVLTCPQCGAVFSAPPSPANCPQCGAAVSAPAAYDRLEAGATSFVPPASSRPEADAAPAKPAAVQSELHRVEAEASAAPAMSSEVRPDPLAATPLPPESPPAVSAPAPSTAPPPLSPAPASTEPPNPAPSALTSQRTLLFAATVVIFLGAFVFAGKTIFDGLERRQTEERISAILERAEYAYQSGDVDFAAELAAEARDQQLGSPQPLDPRLARQWEPNIKHLELMKVEVDRLRQIYATGQSDLSETRSRLENRKLLLGPITESNRPVAAQADTLLADLERLELSRKHERLRAELDAANELYRSGKIEKASAQALEIGSAMAERPRLPDSAMEQRLAVLVRRADQLKAARDVRNGAQANFGAARKKLQAQLDALDPKDEDLRPLIERIAALKAETIREEKLSQKLAPEELAEINGILAFLHAYGHSAERGPTEGGAVGLKFEGQPLRLGFQHRPAGSDLFIEVGENRFLVDPRHLEPTEVEGHPFLPRPERTLRHALALGAAMTQAGVAAEEVWDARDEAPFLFAHRLGEDGREYAFLKDRIYSGRPRAKTEWRVDAEADFRAKAEALARAVEADAPTETEIRTIVAIAIRATAQEADWFDHLPGEYVRKVIAGGYVEDNMPGAAVRLKQPLANFREAYAKISTPIVTFAGTSAQGDVVEEMRTFEDHAVWRLYDHAAGQTSFAIKDPDDEKDCLFVIYDYPGSLRLFPAERTPVRIRMTHQAVGVIASLDPATGKMVSDPSQWALAATLESPGIPKAVRTAKGLGTPEWAWPPHVLLVDRMANTLGIVTPFGRLDVKDFKLVPETQRTQAMEDFLNQMARVMPTANYLHLYFRYFHEYILDSPVTSRPDLFGSRAHCGDIHQTTYESLLRFMGGRYVGDCDDLAETFMNVTRRQGKLSYVMALPQHAACGWAEQAPGGGEYTFYVADTGPPREFKDKELDKVIELACRAYDDDKTMRFDPKSLGFLFRFNGEPTRTPYYLSSRMFVDRTYAEIMERVQSYWHFHFYSLGIRTMTDLIAKGDRVPENCMELAGLYQWVREVEESVKWTNEALKQFSPDEHLSRMSEEFRIALMWREEHEPAKAYAAVQKTVQELKRLQDAPHTFDYTSMRLEVAALLAAVDRPWEAWDVVRLDMFAFAQRGMLKIEHAGALTGIYVKMQDLIRAGRKPTVDERESLQTLEDLLTFFYSDALFDPEDDFNDLMNKYAFLGLWYAGRFGRDRFQAELLKDGPYPDPARPRKHQDRSDPETEDWKWIRLSLNSYSFAIGDALDFDDPPEKWRKGDVVKLTDQMVKAAAEARKFGSLSSAEYELLSARVLRAFLIKDWADLENVLKETQERRWARLTSDICETFGRGARFVTPEEFAARFRVLAKYIQARTAYFTVVYEAYRADAVQQAVAAAQVAVECCPADADMRREAEYLTQLATKRLALKAQREKEKAAAQLGAPDKPAPSAKELQPKAAAPLPELEPVEAR